MRPSQAEFLEWFSYDEDTGALVRKKSVRPDMIGKAAHFRQFLFKGRQYMTPHVIWFMQTGDWPKNIVDHVNGEQSDNSWSNLRLATASENQYNKVVKDKIASDVVHKKDGNRKKPYAARVRFDGHRYHLGHFETRAEAEEVAKAFRLSCHGRFAPEHSRKEFPHGKSQHD